MSALEDRELHSARLTAEQKLQSVLGGYDDGAAVAAAGSGNGSARGGGGGYAAYTGDFGDEPAAATGAAAAGAGATYGGEYYAYHNAAHGAPPATAPSGATRNGVAPLPTSLLTFSKTLALAKPGAAVGPNTYHINYSQTARNPPRVSMGSQQRFRGSRHVYISRGHNNADLLCTASPGPKYFVPPVNPTTRRPPAHSMGPPAGVSYAHKPADRKTNAGMFAARGSDEVGPAMYNPKHEAVLGAAPRAVFSQAPRFGDTQQASARAPTGHGVPAGTEYQPRHEAVLPRQPQFSFGHVTTGVDRLTGRNHALAPNGPHTDLGRTSFITHSIRGGLAKPATAEHKPIGPADYYPDHSIGKSRAPRHTFAATPRFGAINGATGGVHASYHASTGVGSGPGPKYVFRDLSDKVDAMRKKLSLTWTP